MQWHMEKYETTKIQMTAKLERYDARTKTWKSVQKWETIVDKSFVSLEKAFVFREGGAIGVG